jgi:hypothetical protein
MMVEQEGIATAHLLQGCQAVSAGGTAEKALRRGADGVADWVVLVEAVDAAALISSDHVASVEAFLLEHGAQPVWERGVYQLQFGLTAQDVHAAETTPKSASETD